MNLREYLAERRKHETITAFCARNDLNPMSVTLIANGHRPAGPKLALKISKATGGVVPVYSMLNPKLWGSDDTERTHSASP